MKIKDLVFVGAIGLSVIVVGCAQVSSNESQHPLEYRRDQALRSAGIEPQSSEAFDKQRGKELLSTHLAIRENHAKRYLAKPKPVVLIAPRRTIKIEVNISNNVIIEY